MSSTRVKYVSYRITSDPHTQYPDPKPMEFDNALGRFVVNDHTLTIFPEEDFAAVVEARTAIEPFLRAWEIDAALKCGPPGVIRFAFSDGQVEDLRPERAGSVVIQASVSSSLKLGDHLVAIVTKASYPDPPTYFQATTEVEMASRRWFGYLARREPLPAVAYFIFTVLVNKQRTLAQAANMLNVGQKVLRKLSELSSTRGDASILRKVEDPSRMQGLLDKERAWLEAVVPMLVYRIGARAGGEQLEPISLGDLPDL